MAARRSRFADIDDPIEDPATKRTDIWIGLAIGLSVAALLGIGLVVFFLRRKKEALPAPTPTLGQPQLPSPQIIPQSPIYIFANGAPPTMPGLASPVAPVSSVDVPDIADEPSSAAKTLRTLVDQFARPSHPSIVKTYTLPSLTDSRSQAVRLAQAVQVPYEVVLRVVGAAGTFGVFSLDPTELNRPEVVTVPAGDTLIIPSGQTNTLKLLPRQAVFGKGSAPNVLVSITATEAVERIFTS